ncbi:hypothetical protein C0W35_06780 [Photobacterium kishitanii]|uniref:hypothetical protein n=1 Tax=Photobacterium kishitanii TaxID=318456 RepID=UPI000D174DE7|nr:hypothetical protein [Photobacterium kishitanii]PSU95292.1 hypothetical protein C0W35_06780 [Photobacterium kishitanii]
MRYKFNPNALTEEKSLWDIYKKAFIIFPNKLQIVIVLAVVTCLSINAFALEMNTAILLSDVRGWASFGFNFAITTLGFLIAGFTIFATLTKPDMMLAMMDHTKKEYNLPTLKYNFFVFIKVFISYLFFAVVYVLAMLLGQKGGFLSNVIELIPNSLCVKIVLIKVSYVVIGSSFIHLLLQLKSFIFNIYMIVMNMLRWEHREKNVS